VFSLALIATGLAGLIWLAPWLSAAIAAITAFVYIALYTPMKRVTSLATIVGAVPGALPPLIGWTAAGGTLAEPAPWSLFLLMFVWQLPHFLSISWMYRDDYAKAGLPMLAVVDRDGSMTGRQAALWAGTLVPIALLPAAAHLTEPTYGIGAAILGVGFAVMAVRFALTRARSDARNLFLVSITYLPLLWVLMAIYRH
jgi:protoheme IX farnesyltransferase